MLRYSLSSLVLVSGFAVALSGFSHVSAWAQDQDMLTADELRQQVRQLENQVQTMSRYVYAGDQSAQPADGATMTTVAPGDEARARADMALLSEQLSTLMQQMQGLTEQVERIDHRTRQLDSEVNRVRTTTGQALRALGDGVTDIQEKNATPPLPEGMIDQPQAPAAAAAPVVEGAQFEFKNVRRTANGDEPQVVLEPSRVPRRATDHSPANDPEGKKLGELGEASTIYSEALNALHRGESDTAREMLETFTTRFPDHTLYDNAVYWLAESYYVTGEFDEAAKIFARGYKENPSGRKAADNLLKLGLSLRETGRTEDACVTLQQFLTAHPRALKTSRDRAQRELDAMSCDG